MSLTCCVFNTVMKELYELDLKSRTFLAAVSLYAC
jgi:hypothetical protein